MLANSPVCDNFGTAFSSAAAPGVDAATAATVAAHPVAAAQVRRWLAAEMPQARILPALLGTSLFFILLYGVGDFPDHAIRHAQFYLLGLALALTAPPRTEAAPAP